MPSMDTDRQVTMFLREGEGGSLGQNPHTCPGGRSLLCSPVTFENLVPVAVRLEGLVPAKTLRATTRTIKLRHLANGGGGGVSSLT